MTFFSVGIQGRLKLTKIFALWYH